jgi:hypothetical protein
MQEIETENTWLAPRPAIEGERRKKGGKKRIEA